MRILLLSPWRNVWVDYLKTYFESKGHQFFFKQKLNFNDVAACDVVISGWADQFAEALGNFPKLCSKYLLFLRSYEYYSGIYRKISYKNFDFCFFLNEHIFNKASEGLGATCNSVLTRNGIDLNKFKVSLNKDENSIIFLADINHKKGISLLVQIANKLPEYRITVAGNVQEIRFKEYLEEMTNNCDFIGYSNDINTLLENKRYILCTSPAEGNPNNIIEGMACGVEPVVHRYLGHKGQFPECSFYSTVDEAVELIRHGDKPDPHRWRKWAENTYDMWQVYQDIEAMI